MGQEATVSDVKAILERNLAEVKRRIADACRRAGRHPADVTLVAVTKYVSVDVVRALFELGVTSLGESRPQELWKKAPVVPEANWHLVGHLQRNKIERTLPLVCLIHSVDSFRLLEALEAEAGKQNRKTDVLLEFNLSGESAKHGFASSEVTLIPEALKPLRFLRIRGLMTMSAVDATAAQARETFAALRRIKGHLDPLLPKLPLEHSLVHLSMGMTGDFEAAVEEGATLVRIGTALFRGLEE